MPGKTKTVRFLDADDVCFTPSPSYSVSSLPSSSGPMTPPFQYQPMVAAPHPHLVLQPTGHNTPNLLYNVSLPAANVVPSKINAHMPQSVMLESATSPALSSVRIVHPRLGTKWAIVVTPASGNFVRVADVLEGIYASLRQNASSADYDCLPEHAKKEVTAAFQRRYHQMPDPTMQQMEKHKGLKRVDFLGATVAFHGLVPSTAVPGAFELCVL
ncbi:hypothetical protein MKEN_00798300 [Mycena kentingensis (nom. inval.)]|nr:hypothetical protein MKEN_00798300 [Mycena kentingensis (nom. inval.)]